VCLLTILRGMVAACSLRHQTARIQSTTNSRSSIIKIDRRVLHDTCYIAHQFQGQRSMSQARIVCTSHLCLFLIQETKCCTCVIWGGRGHTVSAEPGGHVSYSCRFYSAICTGCGTIKYPNTKIAISQKCLNFFIKFRSFNWHNTVH